MAILITQRHTVRFEKILRVVKHRILLFKFQKTNYAAQGSNAQTCAESPVAKARHM